MVTHGSLLGTGKAWLPPGFSAETLRVLRTINYFRARSITFLSTAFRIQGTPESPFLKTAWYLEKERSTGPFTNDFIPAGNVGWVLSSSLLKFFLLLLLFVFFSSWHSFPFHFFFFWGGGPKHPGEDPFEKTNPWAIWHLFHQTENCAEFCEQNQNTKRLGISVSSFKSSNIYSTKWTTFHWAQFTTSEIAQICI